ncbi:MAG: ribosomal L7Ae/L30e/S12e/Gadd45 family protein [Nanopusillaceae archaeon]
MNIVDELRNYDKDKIILGTKRTLKYLKLGKISKVYIASNTPKEIVEDIEYYSKLSNIEIKKLDLTNEELRVILKKPFKISVVSILK